MGKDERPGNARAPMPGCVVSVQYAMLVFLGGI